MDRSHLEFSTSFHCTLVVSSTWILWQILFSRRAGADYPPRESPDRGRLTVVKEPTHLRKGRIIGSERPNVGVKEGSHLKGLGKGTHRDILAGE